MSQEMNLEPEGFGVNKKKRKAETDLKREEEEEEEVESASPLEKYYDRIVGFRPNLDTEWISARSSLRSFQMPYAGFHFERAKKLVSMLSVFEHLTQLALDAHYLNDGLESFVKWLATDPDAPRGIMTLCIQVCVDDEWQDILPEDVPDLNLPLFRGGSTITKVVISGLHRNEEVRLIRALGGFEQITHLSLCESESDPYESGEREILSQALREGRIEHLDIIGGVERNHEAFLVELSKAPRPFLKSLMLESFLGNFGFIYNCMNDKMFPKLEALMVPFEEDDQYSIFCLPDDDLHLRATNARRLLSESDFDLEEPAPLFEELRSVFKRRRALRHQQEADQAKSHMALYALSAIKANRAHRFRDSVFQPNILELIQKMAGLHYPDPRLVQEPGPMCMNIMAEEYDSVPKEKGWFVPTPLVTSLSISRLLNTRYANAIVYS
jgi:hypothetical protein